MAVITISRGSFSGGKMLAESLAERLGYRCIDRDTLVEKAASLGVSSGELLATLEKPPSLLDRFKHKKYIYLAAIQAALTDEVRKGKAVYHGNAGHLLLRGVGHVLRTRIIAPIEFRVAMVRDRLHLGPSEAKAHIQKMDQDRARWTQYLYGIDWGDPAYYDVVINLERVDLQEACETIASMAGQERFRENPESLAAMEDLALSSRVRASLVTNPGTALLELDVNARAGRVSLGGLAYSPLQVKEIEDLVWKVPGVIDIHSDLHVGAVEV